MTKYMNELYMLFIVLVECEWTTEWGTYEKQNGTIHALKLSN